MPSRSEQAPRARPGDTVGWARLSPEVQAYERARSAALGTGHVVRSADVVALERGLDGLRRSC